MIASRPARSGARLLAEERLAAAVVFRASPPPAGTPAPHTPREWFDLRYECVRSGERMALD